jgi:hypothetical protein
VRYSQNAPVAAAAAAAAAASRVRTMAVVAAEGRVYDVE